MKIANFIQDPFKIHTKNVSIVKCLQKFLYENYPIASIYLKYLYFIYKNGTFSDFYIKKGNF